MSIQAISTNDIHSITSGQVITDLSSCIKELLENSIDAHARQIEITFKNYGSDSIEIQDDGEGIGKDNFESLCLKNHTSKITTFEDICDSDFQSLGFRGEALSSMCCLSKLSITTSTAETTPIAYKLEYDSQGKLVSSNKTSRNKGTTITVQDFFYNLPVRRKNLVKNSRKSFQKCIQLIQDYCIIFKDVHIKCWHLTSSNRKNLVLANAPRDTTLLKNLITLFGSSTLKGVGEIETKVVIDHKKSFIEEYNFDGGEAVLTGCISKNFFGCGRASKDKQFIYFNKRPVDYPKIINVLNEVYKSFNNIQYPFFVLNFEMGSNLIDVNVTPDKRTVLINNEVSFLTNLRDALVDHFNNQEMTLFTNSQQVPKEASIADGEIIKGKRKLNEDEDDVKYSNNSSVKIEIIDSNGNVELPQVKNNVSDTIASQSKIVEEPEYSDSEHSSSPKDKEEENEGEVENEEEEEEDEEENSDESSDVEETQPKGNDDTLPHRKLRKIEILQPIRHTRNISPKKPFPQKTLVTPGIPVFSAKGFQTRIDSFAHTQEVEGSCQDHCSSHGNSGEISSDEDMSEEDNLVIDVDGTRVVETISTSHSGARKASPKKIAVLAEDVAIADASVEVENEEEFSEDSIDFIDTAPREINERVSQAQSNASVTRPLPSDLELSKLYTYERQVSVDVETILERYKEHSDFFKQKHVSLFNKNEKIASKEEGEQYLTLTVSKSDFTKMKVVGQFNLGFIICMRKTDKGKHDLFIVDQHASDEKYNFENLQKNTIFKSQSLIQPKMMELSVIDELIVLENLKTFELNGFKLKINKNDQADTDDLSSSTDNGQYTGQISISCLPFSKKTQFSFDDFYELVHLIKNSPNHSNTAIRCSKIRAMFAMRACRMSIMIGKPLNMKTMEKVVYNLSGLDKPWNCPHGRPTMRHLMELKDWKSFNKDYEL